MKFGTLKIGGLGRRLIAEVLDRNEITEGRLVKEFEEKFAAEFGWRHAVMTSSGSTAAQVVWAAASWIHGKYWGEFRVATPASAFVSTTNSVLVAGCEPLYLDIDETLNMEPWDQSEWATWKMELVDGVQFVANMGRFINVDQIFKLIRDAARPMWLIGDLCEGHGGLLEGKHSDWFDAAVYSLYPAHMVIAGEGGVICTDDPHLADICRSIKSHGRPVGSNWFDYQRIGFNAKTTEFTAAIGLDTLSRFQENFGRRREVRHKMLKAMEQFEDKLITFPDAAGELIAPHAFPVLLRKSKAVQVTLGRLIKHLIDNGVEVKTLFGSLPTQHDAFRPMGYVSGAFPTAESVGERGCHWGCHEEITDQEINRLQKILSDFFLTGL